MKMAARMINASPPRTPPMIPVIFTFFALSASANICDVGLAPVMVVIDPSDKVETCGAFVVNVNHSPPILARLVLLIVELVVLIAPDVVIGVREAVTTIVDPCESVVVMRVVPVAVVPPVVLLVLVLPLAPLELTTKSKCATVILQSNPDVCRGV
jgi:hypothetical protein